MTADAAAPIGAELAKEGIAPVDEAVDANREGDAAVVRGAVHLDAVRPGAVVIGCGKSRQTARQQRPCQSATSKPLVRHFVLLVRRVESTS